MPTTHRLRKHADYQHAYARSRKQFKRRLRAVVAANLPLLTAPVDVILHPRRSVLTLEFAHLNREIATIFRAVQTSVERAARAQAASAAAPPPQ